MPDERPELEEEQAEPQEEQAEPQERQDGSEEQLDEYERELARYLEKRIKPNLSSGTIPLMARSIAKEIARREPPGGLSGGNGAGEHEASSAPDFEADMHELQEELGEDWILRFSVRGEDGWLTAETEDASQRVEAPDAEGLLRIVDAVKEAGGREG
jgi:hypothetical protein